MACDDLKYEILQLKKKLKTISSENSLLKVKVRKLQNELERKDKQIDSILDPKKSSCIQKILSERGATMIINLKQRNSELQQALKLKDSTIKKLQSDIETSKLYKKNVLPTKTDSKHLTTKSSTEISNPPKLFNRFRSCSLSVRSTPKQTFPKSSSDIQMQYVRLAQNLQKIRLAKSGNLNINSSKTSEKSFASTSKEDEFSSVGVEHQEIQQHLSELLNEMKNMKSTVSQLFTEQQNTKKILTDKNKNIQMLSRTVENLQESNSYINAKLKSEQLERSSGTSYSQSEDNSEVDSTKHTNSMQSLGVTYVMCNRNDTVTQMEKLNRRNDDDDDVQTEILNLPI